MGAGFARNAAVVGIGIASSGPVRAFLRYDGEYSAAQMAHIGTAGITVSF
jgi:hypothetical protein